MPKFSQASIRKLNTCEKDLQVLFNEVIKYFDCTIVTGHRDKASQNAAYDSGASKLKYPQSNHNSNPSMAVDVAPYPINWQDTPRFYYFSGFVMGIAEYLLATGQMTHRIRWGGDWNMDKQVKDNTFNDLVHFELRPIK